MPSIRATTLPLFGRDATEREPAASRDAVRPVGGGDLVDADRRRSLREELDAAEEHLPMAEPSEAEADVQEVVATIGRLGPEALRVLQPPSEVIRRLTERGVDEQA